jgi:hypothetical protein
MDDLEKQLLRAFAPEDPPDGFAARVVERTCREKRVAIPRWMAAAAAVLVLAGAGYGYRQHQGETAKREVLLAFRIASAKVNHIQTQVSR